MIFLCEYFRYRRKCVLFSLLFFVSRFFILVEVVLFNFNKFCNVNLWLFYNLKKV